MRYAVLVGLFLAGIGAIERASAEETGPRFVPNVIPRFEPTVPSQADVPPLCITVDGVDIDLDELLSEYQNAWTWPKTDGSHGGEDEESIRHHLSDPKHSVQGIEALDFETLKKVHAVLHEREERAKEAAAKTVKPVVKSLPVLLPQASSSCPNGVCPIPQRNYYVLPRGRREARRR
jgi:hypothetical protein